MEILLINGNDDIDNLLIHIEEEFSPKGLVAKLKSVISPILKCILIEYPFVDKDYNSTYHNFYSKKCLRYPPYCTRLHFFDEPVQLINGCLNPLNFGDFYLGFMVLRPTIAPLGRTIISPKLIKGFSGYLMTAEYKTHINGHELSAKGFPFKSQHTDVAVCAHIVCWSILRYYSQKFPIYPEKMTFDITQMASSSAQGGLMPSTGLRVDHAERVFSLAGCYPHVYYVNEYKDNERLFYRILYSYVESGFPLFAAMHEKRHAITLIGHGPYDAPDNVRYDHEKGRDKFAYTWDFITTLVVNDDNKMPYNVLSKEDSSSYKIEDIDAFVIPLPEEIYYPTEALFCHLDLLWEYNLLDLSFIERPIIRCFIAISSVYKCFLMENKDEIPFEIFISSIGTHMPQYVWIVEISTSSLLEDKKVAARLVFDATSNMHEKYPFLVLHDSKNVFVYDRGVTKKFFKYEFESELQSFKAFDRNLEYFKN